MNGCAGSSVQTGQKECSGASEMQLMSHGKCRFGNSHVTRAGVATWDDVVQGDGRSCCFGSVREVVGAVPPCEVSNCATQYS